MKFNDTIKEAEEDIFKPASGEDLTQRREKGMVMSGILDLNSIGAKVKLSEPRRMYGNNNYSTDMRIEHHDPISYELKGPSDEEVQALVKELEKHPNYEQFKKDIVYIAKGELYLKIRSEIAKELIPVFTEFNNKVKAVLDKHK